MPLRERIKQIFKKYGVTVTAIFLAAGVTIGAVIGTIGTFRLDYEYEIEYEYDFSILVFRLHIITTQTHFIP